MLKGWSNAFGVAALPGSTNTGSITVARGGARLRFGLGAATSRRHDCGCKTAASGRGGHANIVSAGYTREHECRCRPSRHQRRAYRRCGRFRVARGIQRCHARVERRDRRALQSVRVSLRHCKRQSSTRANSRLRDSNARAAALLLRRLRSVGGTHRRHRPNRTSATARC
jgi:hypothetical protein